MQWQLELLKTPRLSHLCTARPSLGLCFCPSTWQPSQPDNGWRWKFLRPLAGLVRHQWAKRLGLTNSSHPASSRFLWGTRKGQTNVPIFAWYWPWGCLVFDRMVVESCGIQFEGYESQPVELSKVNYMNMWCGMNHDFSSQNIWKNIWCIGSNEGSIWRYPVTHWHLTWPTGWLQKTKWWTPERQRET